MQLQCIADNCPLTGRSVSMLKCCGNRKSTQPCPHYGAEPWSEFAVVTCQHPDAKQSARAEREANTDGFRAIAGVAHLTHVEL